MKNGSSIDAGAGAAALSFHAFGERAAAWCATLGHDVSAVVTGEAELPAAFVRAVELRLRGTPFLAVPLLDDLAAAYVRRRALRAIAAGDLDAQQRALLQLALDSRKPEIVASTPELQRHPGWLRALYDFIIAGDGVVVRSFAEMARLRELCPTAALQRLAVLGGPAALALPPAAPAHERDLVLLWAPNDDAPMLGLETFALAICGRPAAVICRSGRLEGIAVDFGHLADAPRFLSRARVVIIADTSDPAPAVAFAAAGYSVIAAATSGAVEQLDGAIEYDPCSVSALSEAIVAAWTVDRAARIRAPGERQAGAARFVVAEDARATTARALAATAFYIEDSYDLRRDAFDRLAGAGGTFVAANVFDAETAARRLDAGDPLRFESWHDVTRTRRQLGARMRRVCVEPERDSRVPAALNGARTADAIVVWAPSRSAADVTVIAMGLHYEKRPVFIVCGGGELPGSRAVVVGLDRAAEVLARAAVCIDAETRTPSAALALAALGIPLAVASTSGAAEYLDYVALYDPWDHISVFSAVAIAKASLPPLLSRRVTADGLTARLAAYTSDVAENGPLVSVVLLTRNRRNLLARAIASIARQRYRNIETIVVRNGGVRVDDVVAALPGARLIESEVNLGVIGGTNLGTVAARGKYIAYLADDDEYLPEHIGSAVSALLRTKSSFAHGGMLAVHLVPDGAGGYGVNGYGIACERPAEPGFMRAMNSVATPAMLIDRELLAQSGNWFEEFGPMTDYELVMRFMLDDELVYVNRPAVVQTYRRDATQYSASMNPEMPRILGSVYARHPLGDEPWAQRARTQWIANFERHHSGGSATPLWYPQPTVTFPAQPYSVAEITADDAIPAQSR